MKFIFSIFLAGLLLLSSCSQKLLEPAAGKNELRVLSYNIHHANPPSKKDFIDIDAIVRVIKNENPDVIAMQEVDKFTKRSGNVDQAKVIAKKTGMYYHFFKGIDYEGGDYGIAIFSKWPIKNPRQLMLPRPTEKSEQRSLGYVEITHPNGQRFVLACTHLCVEGENSRVAQVKAIMEELGKVDLPIVLAGDLNSVRTSASMNLLQQQFKNSCTDNCGFTVPVVNPRRNIDYILTKNADWPVSDYEVVNETYASDHRPVSATFIIKP